MKLAWIENAAAAAMIGYAWTAATPARAAITDYDFQLLQNEIRKGDSAEIAVRLTDKRTGKAVPGAVIFAQRIDMAPDSMEEMTSSIAAIPSTEPGVYRFKVNLTMAGGWRLSLGAKVQGETGTVESRLTFKAVP
jgi:hypothetical protein